MMQEQHKQMMKDLVDGKLLSVNQITNKRAEAALEVADVEVARVVQQPSTEKVPVKAIPISRPPVTEEKTLDELILEYISKNKPS